MMDAKQYMEKLLNTNFIELEPLEKLLVLVAPDSKSRLQAADQLARLEAVVTAALEVVNARNMTAAVIATQALAAALAALEQETKE